MAAQVRTVHQGGSRFYVNPETRVTVPGVTSIIGMAPKPFLPNWAAKMAGEVAVDSIPFLTDMVSVAGRDAAVQYVSGASRRYTKVRSDVGTMAHDLFERMIRGEAVGRVHPDMEPYRRNFGEFLDTVQPRLVGAEDIAWSDTHAYAGSFDAMLEVRLDEFGQLDEGGKLQLTMTDWKTGKSTYPDVALQMSAYAHADRIISADGATRPMPDFDGGAVLHITADQWSFKPVRADRETFEYFLALRKVFDWDRDFSKDVIGRPIARSGGAMVTGTQRRGR